MLLVSCSGLDASSQFFTSIPRFPYSLEFLTINDKLADKQKFSAIDIAHQCFTNLPNLKFLGLKTKDESTLREVLLTLKAAGLPAERICIDFPFSEDEISQTHKARLSTIYQEVLGHEPPENR